MMCFKWANLIFIIPDLVYVYAGDSQCINYKPESFIFDLSVWLMVDGYLRIINPLFMLLALTTIKK